VVSGAACGSEVGPPSEASVVDALAAAAGCDAPEAHPPASEDHISEGEIEYERLPPEGGDHRPMWSETGVHARPIEDGLQVHNLEHGHIGLQYASSVSADRVAVLVAAASTQLHWIFVAPYARFGDGAVLSLTAWGHRVDCSEPLADAGRLRALVDAFITEHRDRAVESIPGQPLG
jgi:hypothetical protein